MKKYTYIAFVLLFFIGCESDIDEVASVSESELIIYNEEILAQPIADELGFAVISKNDGVINLTRIDDEGNKSYLSDLSNNYANNFNPDSYFESELISSVDGYYVLSNNTTDSTLLVIKMDKNGLISWDHELSLIGETNNFEFLRASSTIDGGLKVVISRSRENTDPLFLRIVDFNSNGTVNPNPVNKNLNIRSLMFIIPTYDEGYAMVARNVSQGQISNSFILFDQQLDTVYHASLSTGDLQIFNMLTDENNNFLLTGFSNNQGQLSAELFTIFGGLVDQSTIPFTGSKVPHFHSSIQLDDGYLFVGNEATPNNVNWNSIYDISESDIIWDKVTFTEQNEFDERFESDYATVGGAIKTRTNGGYLILGSAVSFNLYKNMILIKTNPSGKFDQ